ncbi:CGNR zinc finger domain-containing protein [Terracoccus sp. 273MFTsu3.1]|uniref:ABATE domain-containing protein n=1 Tax=Terracoccus sp. 273MFTsu3.1 TaxID=1172188 RepID=UPI00037D1AE9|nr:CGNR zinc finger domain-containing protein [Terracoccus sp. 273MFTsu3.1]
MQTYAVDGRELPLRIAGDPALELVNTLARWSGTSTDQVDHLHDYDDLVVWARECGLVDEVAAARLRRSARRDRVTAGAVLREVRRLRRDVHDLAVGLGRRAALARVSTLAVEARQSQSLTATADAVTWRFTRDAGLHEPLYAVAQAAAALLTSDASGHVSACPGDGCGAVFLNPSGRRRWCIMSVCGNRAKARAWAARQHASRDPAPS